MSHHCDHCGYEPCEGATSSCRKYKKPVEPAEAEDHFTEALTEHFRGAVREDRVHRLLCRLIAQERVYRTETHAARCAAVPDLPEWATRTPPSPIFTEDQMAVLARFMAEVLPPEPLRVEVDLEGRIVAIDGVRREDL